MAETKIRPGESFPAASQPAGDSSLSFSNIGSGIEGDFGAESSRIPFLSIGQRTSDITETHPEALGSMIYAGKLVIPKPVTITIYGARQYYKQNLPFERNPSVRAQTFKTKEQVFAVGGNLDRFVKSGVDDRNFVPEMCCKVAVFADAKGKKSWLNNDMVLSYPVSNGTSVVPALWTLRGVAYGQLVPNLRMIDRALREDGKEIGFARFNATITKQIFSANSTFVPVLDRLPDDNSQDVVTILHNIFEV